MLFFSSKGANDSSDIWFLLSCSHIASSGRPAESADGVRYNNVLFMLFVIC